jgi:hypothetical protein
MGQSPRSSSHFGFVVFANLAALGGLLFIIAPRVPPEAKDGLFGAAAGLVLGALFLNTMLAIVQLLRDPQG